MNQFEHMTIRINDQDESKKVVEILNQLGYSTENTWSCAARYFDGSVIITNDEKRGYAFVMEGVSAVPADEYTAREFIEKYGVKGMKHTPEPWANGTAILKTDEIADLLLDYGHYTAHLGRISSIGEDDALIAARIVACVNACAGMDDPATEIAALRKRIEELTRLAEQPTTVEGWLKLLPDGYRERALVQTDEYRKNWDSGNMLCAVESFARWSTTDEKDEFWRAVCDHYTYGTPLPKLPTN